MAHAGAGATQGLGQDHRGKRGLAGAKRRGGKTGQGAAAGQGQWASAASPGAITDTDKGRGPCMGGPVGGQQGLTRRGLSRKSRR